MSRYSNMPQRLFLWTCNYSCSGEAGNISSKMTHTAVFWMAAHELQQLYRAQIQWLQTVARGSAVRLLRATRSDASPARGCPLVKRCPFGAAVRSHDVAIEASHFLTRKVLQCTIRQLDAAKGCRQVWYDTGLVARLAWPDSPPILASSNPWLAFQRSEYGRLNVPHTSNAGAMAEPCRGLGPAKGAQAKILAKVVVTKLKTHHLPHQPSRHAQLELNRQ